MPHSICHRLEFHTGRSSVLGSWGWPHSIRHCPSGDSLQWFHGQVWLGPHATQGILWNRSEGSHAPMTLAFCTPAKLAPHGYCHHKLTVYAQWQVEPHLSQQEPMAAKGHATGMWEAESWGSMSQWMLSVMEGVASKSARMPSGSFSHRLDSSWVPSIYNNLFSSLWRYNLGLLS